MGWGDVQRLCVCACLYVCFLTRSVFIFVSFSFISSRHIIINRILKFAAIDDSQRENFEKPEINSQTYFQKKVATSPNFRSKNSEILLPRERNGLTSSSNKNLQSRRRKTDNKKKINKT